MAYMRDASGRRLDSFEAIARNEAASVGGVSSARIALPRQVATEPFGSPPAHPVITDSSSTLKTNDNARIYRYASGAWSASGTRSTTVDANGALFSRQTGCTSNYETIMWGPEFTAIGGDATNQFVEVGFALLSGVSTARLIIEENGRRYSLTPEEVNGLAGATNYVVQLPLPVGSVKTFRVLGSRWRINYIRAPYLSLVQPVTAERYKIAVFGASFVNSDYSWVQGIGMLSGAEVFQCGQSGTGVLNPGDSTNSLANGGVYNTPARIAALAAIKPDAIGIEMSGNDGPLITDLASFNAYVTATKAFLRAVAASCPGAPISVFDAPVRGFSDTVSNNLAWVLAGTRKAINEVPEVNVIGYHDYLGTIVNTPTYTSSAAYAVGARVVALGAIWECTTAVASAPSIFNTSSWKLFGWYTGTGRIGAPTGNGTRDVLMGEGSDLTHPSAHGYRVQATVTWPDLQADITRNRRVDTLPRASFVPA